MAEGHTHSTAQHSMQSVCTHGRSARRTRCAWQRRRGTTRAPPGPPPPSAGSSRRTQSPQSAPQSARRWRSCSQREGRAGRAGVRITKILIFFVIIWQGGACSAKPGASRRLPALPTCGGWHGPPLPPLPPTLCPRLPSILYPKDPGSPPPKARQPTGCWRSQSSSGGASLPHP